MTLCLCDSNHHNLSMFFLSAQLRESAFPARAIDEEKETVFWSIKISNWSGIDRLEIKPVKQVAGLISPMLTFVFNLHFADGSSLKRMQDKIPTLICKGRKKIHCRKKNYRPICVLPLFSKILDKLIYARVASSIIKLRANCLDTCKGLQENAHVCDKKEKYWNMLIICCVL